MKEISGQTLKYKEYEFTIYGTNEEGKYLAKPIGTCGKYTSYAGEAVENYVSATFGIEGKVTAQLFKHAVVEERDIVKSYQISKEENIWMNYLNKANALSGDIEGYRASPLEYEAYIIPKLTIEPSAIIKPLNSSYLLIQ